MRLSSIFLTLSLGLNAALAVATWSRISQAVSASTPTPFAEPHHKSPHTSEEISNATAQREPLWIAGGEKDLDALILRLRSAGISDRELSAVLLAAIQQSIQKFISGSYLAPTYWLQPGAVHDRKWSAELLTRRRDENRLISKYLLTPELFPFCGELVANAREEFGDFSMETLRKLTLQQMDHQQKSMSIELTRSSSPTPGEPRFSLQEQAALKALNEEQENAIKALLSPEEYARYELRNGDLARSLRMRLQPFQPTEAEYKAIYAAEKPFRESDRLGLLNREERTALQKKRDADLVAALGPERAADYAELQRGGSELPRLMARLNLPLTTISTINKVRDEANTSAKVIMNNAQLTPAERSTQLAALAAKAEQTLSGTLGAEGFEAYSESKGEWLRNLKPPATAKH